MFFSKNFGTRTPMARCPNPERRNTERQNAEQRNAKFKNAERRNAECRMPNWLGLVWLGVVSSIFLAFGIQLFGIPALMPNLAFRCSAFRRLAFHHSGFGRSTTPIFVIIHLRFTANLSIGKTGFAFSQTFGTNRVKTGFQLFHSFGQGDRIGRILAVLGICLLRTFLNENHISCPTFQLLFSQKKLRIEFGKNMDWAAFWASFHTKHLVTLPSAEVADVELLSFL
jgi:hypothetical protein